MTSLLDDVDPNEPLLDPEHDYYTELVGEDKKYKDNKALAYKSMHADLTIENMKRELAGLRSELNKTKDDYSAATRLQEAIDKLSGLQLPPPDDTTLSDDGIPPALKPEDIETLVSKKLAEAKAKDKEEANHRQVQAKLRELYGDKAAQVLKSQLEQLGLTPEFADDLARRHPAVFMKTFGLEDQKQLDTFTAPPASNQRPSFTSGNTKRDWKYYENLRSKDSRSYWDAKTQVQMHKDMIALGDSFGMPGQFNTPY